MQNQDYSGSRFGDDLLSATVKKMSAIDPIELAATAIRHSTHAAYKLALRGDHRAYIGFTNPDIGEMACEHSTVYRPTTPNKFAVGTLHRITQEPFPGEWGEDEPPLERVWYIVGLDGKEYRWTNAEFLRVSMSARWLDEPPAGHIAQSDPK
jgi:hypothetical protein